MTNVAKYLCLLETLKLPEHEEAGTNQNEMERTRLKYNVEMLQKFIKPDLQEVIEMSTTALQATHLQTQIQIAAQDVEAVYVLLLQQVLLQVVTNRNFDSDAKEDLISTRHMNLCIEAVQDLASYALRQQIHPLLCTKGVFAKASRAANRMPCLNYALLQMNIEFFAKMLSIKQFHVANSMEEVLRYYMATIYTLFLGQICNECALDEATLKQLVLKLNFIWQAVSKLVYFRNILELKGIPQLPAAFQKHLHQELLQKLADKDGFTTLVATLQTAQQTKAANNEQTFEIIAKIVAFRGHTKRFQREMIEQVFKFLQLCLLNEAMSESMGAGLLALRRLYDLNAENQTHVRSKLQASLKELTEPEDILTGLIVMDNKEFCLLISLHYNLFCTSIVECLPSELLIAYLPLLLQLYYHMPENFLQRQQVADLITRCLNNRSDAEIQEIVENLYALKFPPEWRELYKRLLLLPNVEHTELCLKIASSDCKQEFSISLALPELLMNAHFHLLTYRIFMVLLRQISSLLEQDQTDEPCSSATDIDFLQNEEELIAFLNSKYPVKVELLLSLNTLISHQPLKAQISENAKDFLQFLRVAIEQRVSNCKQHCESRDQVLLLLLTLSQEMLEQTYAQLPEAFRDFIPTLRSLRQLTPNQLVQQRVDALIAILSDDHKAHAAHDGNAFQQARALLESTESHLQVYGIQMLLDLLRRQDPVVLANGHVIIALALNTLKSKDSYSFLNCVRLFVGLVGVMEAEVLELLSDEYLNDSAQVDFRLVVGEALLKVSQELGPLCYKYKDVLLNCFMHGARSPQNEFRMSAFANLAQLCRTLSYQVHAFFQELLNLIASELTTGIYLPSQRAAVLVVSDLLEGMDNLLDYEDMLLPTYRLLKDIAADENIDERMRLHAATGLRILGEKCKKLLFPEQRIAKEIQIFGIKDKPRGKLKAHILELN